MVKLKNCNMNLLAAVNAAYLEPLSVMLYSLQKHNPGTHTVYILHFDISLSAQTAFGKKLRKHCADMKIVFCQIDVHKFDAIRWSRRYQREAYLRLFMLSVLPEKLERILWLDADILVRGNIQAFYQYPDKGQYAVVCEDMMGRSERYELLCQLGLCRKDRYFNSGIMLLLLRNLRTCFSEDFFFDWMGQNPDKLKYPDQNVLNVCLRKKLVWAAPEKYNVQLLKKGYTSENRLQRKAAKVFHYNTREKPWQAGYNGKEEAEYWRYAIKILGIQSFIKHYLKKYKK